jgi:hypothetical protein
VAIPAGVPFGGEKGGRALATEADKDRITLELQGERARQGVSLAAFDGFVTHLLTALRYHYRAATAAPVKKTGRPFGKDDLATAFRLTAFRTGSGIVTLEPPVLEDARTPALAEVPTLAWENLGDLLDAVAEERPLENAVLDELEAARRSLGGDGRFSVELAGRETTRRQSFDEERIEKLRGPHHPPEARPQAIVGLLHAIDLEPDKVGIRAASGVEWSCRYPADLEDEVLKLIGSRVWVRGSGRATSARSGTLEIDEIHLVPEHEQTSLFTGAPVPLDKLMSSQHVERPQGLMALADPEWPDDEESDRFLEAILSDGD